MASVGLPSGPVTNCTVPTHAIHNCIQSLLYMYGFNHQSILAVVAGLPAPARIWCAVPAEAAFNNTISL